MSETTTTARPDGDFNAAYEQLNSLLTQDSCWKDLEVGSAATILDNVAYWLLYLESNYQHLEFENLGHWRNRFFENPDVLTALTVRLASAQVAGNAALLRDRLTMQAKLAMSTEFDRLQTEIAHQYDQLRTITAQAEQRQAALASRLGFDTHGTRPALVIYSALRATASGPRRTRLSRAFTVVRDEKLDDACAVAGRLVAVQRAIAELKGFASPLDASLEGSAIDEATALGFVDDYLKAALADTADLAHQISRTLGEVVSSPLTAHAGRYLDHVAGGRATPGVALQGCLNLAFDVARQVFGVDCSVTAGSRSGTIRVAVGRQGRNLGLIQINLHAGPHSPSTPNQTAAARALPADTLDAGAPVAMISCRFSTRDSTDVLNLQNAHSLLHEFGHAINHILLERRTGSPSGLDHIPVERLELLSMWFERWVFSDELATRCGLSDRARTDLAFARWAKSVEYRLSHVERGVLAGVDLLMHGDAALGLRSAHAELCARHSGLSEHVLPGDLIGYLEWPMLREKPGAYFSYLWAAAESAALHMSGAGTARPPDARSGPLMACLKPWEPSPPVAAEAAVSYYRQSFFGGSR